MKSEQEYPGGFDSLTIRELLDDLVNAHISKAVTSERMKPADRLQDLAFIQKTIVQAAHLVRSVIEEKEGAYLIGNNTAAQYVGQHTQGERE